MGSLLAGSLLMGCAPEKPSDVDSTKLEIEETSLEGDESEIVVARVDGEEITLEEFERRINGLAPFARVRLQSLERRKEFLRSTVQFEIMADEAERRGYGDRPEVRHAIKETMVRLMVAELLRKEVSISDIDDEMVEAYFEERADEFTGVERRRVARLWTAEKEKIEALVERWEREKPDELAEEMRLFRQFAFRHSEDRDSGDMGGDVGWVVEPDDAFSSAPGTLLGPVEKGDGWEIRMVVEVQESSTPTLEEVESDIRTKLYEEKRRAVRQQYIDELKAQATVELFEDRLEDVRPPSARTPQKLEELPRLPVRGR